MSSSRKEADGVYQISCGAELAWFAEQVNGGKSPLNAVLTRDIDLGGEPWTPIGKKDYGKEFKGTLDGKGHKIKNLCIDSAESYQGLFGTVRDAKQSETSLFQAS